MPQIAERGQQIGKGLLIGLLLLSVAVLGYAFIERMAHPPPDPYRVQAPEWLVGEVIQVAVWNGCGVSGVARTVTQYLRQYGFDVVESGNYETFDVPKTQIIDHVGNRDAALRVARVLGLDESAISVDIRPELYLDLSVIIGQNYRELAPFKNQETREPNAE